MNPLLYRMDFTDKFQGAMLACLAVMFIIGCAI